jgi:hypothetical protein
MGIRKLSILGETEMLTNFGRNIYYSFFGTAEIETRFQIKARKCSDIKEEESHACI